MLLSGNLFCGPDDQKWGSFRCMSESELKKIEQQEQLQIDESVKEEMMEHLIWLSQKFPEPVYSCLEFQFEPLTESERLGLLRRYGEIAGSECVEEFLFFCNLLKDTGKEVVYLTCTFWGGGIVPMFLSALPLMRSLGVDIHWHAMWVSNSAFFQTTKSIHNSLMGLLDSTPDWDVYEKVNCDNKRLYAKLRELSTENVFFFDDPQSTLLVTEGDIAVLHIDTKGTSLETVGDIWRRLCRGFNTAKSFLHQPGMGGSIELDNAKELAPGICLLSAKNQPRSRQEAMENIRKKGTKDDFGREPWLDSECSRWMFVARADPAKGQIPALLAFCEYLKKCCESTLWFFVQFQKDDLSSYLEYTKLQLLIEAREEKRAVLRSTMIGILSQMGQEALIDSLLSATLAVYERIKSQHPFQLMDKVQIFTNLSDDIGDFATFADGHLVLSVREGYNIVISEMATHDIPVIATDYPPFRDRIISGERGGWLVQIPEVIQQPCRLGFLIGYLDSHPDYRKFICDIAERLNYIRENPKEARKVAEHLHEWIKQEGHVLRYHCDRMAVALATKAQLQGARTASEVRKNVHSVLKNRITGLPQF